MNNKNNNYLLKSNFAFDDLGRIEIEDINLLSKINAAAKTFVNIIGGLEADQSCPIINIQCVNGDCTNWKNSMCPHPNKECTDGIIC